MKECGLEVWPQWALWFPPTALNRAVDSNGGAVSRSCTGTRAQQLAEQKRAGCPPCREAPNRMIWARAFPSATLSYENKPLALPWTKQMTGGEGRVCSSQEEKFPSSMETGRAKNKCSSIVVPGAGQGRWIASSAVELALPRPPPHMCPHQDSSHTWCDGEVWSLRPPSPAHAVQRITWLPGTHSGFLNPKHDLYHLLRFCWN